MAPRRSESALSRTCGSTSSAASTYLAFATCSGYGGSDQDGAGSEAVSCTRLQMPGHRRSARPCRTMRAADGRRALLFPRRSRERPPTFTPIDLWGTMPSWDPAHCVCPVCRRSARWAQRSRRTWSFSARTGRPQCSPMSRCNVRVRRILAVGTPNRTEPGQRARSVSSHFFLPTQTRACSLSTPRPMRRSPCAFSSISCARISRQRACVGHRPHLCPRSCGDSVQA